MPHLHYVMEKKNKRTVCGLSINSFVRFFRRTPWVYEIENANCYRCVINNKVQCEILNQNLIGVSRGSRDKAVYYFKGLDKSGRRVHSSVRISGEDCVDSFDKVINYLYRPMTKE